ncbi:uncharacterized protein C6orf118-like [Engraulis encrasicolus]|uniref:uncharacterized protein C6orf118-like n=1 Tax=Engraulis encrasicolus TaxID=184585 RepID=UPI002FCEF19F
MSKLKNVPKENCLAAAAMCDSPSQRQTQPQPQHKPQPKPLPPCHGPRAHLLDCRKILDNLEQAHKADIKTYLAGHLRPDALGHTRWGPRKAFWEAAEACDGRGRSTMGQQDWASFLREQQERAKRVGDMMDAMTNFTSATTSLQGQSVKEVGGSDKSHRSRTSRAPTPTVAGEPRAVLDTAEVFLVKPSRRHREAKTPPHLSQPPTPAGAGPGSHDQAAACAEVDQGRFWYTRTHLGGLTRGDQLRTLRALERSVVQRQDLAERSGMSGNKMADAHHKKLEQELQKLSVHSHSGPSKERLRVISDVFTDVCDRSPAFGKFLREIKAEYDTYIEATLRHFQPVFQDVAEISGVLCGEMGSCFVGEGELEEAEKEVSELVEEARRVLEENNRVRQEYQLAQESCPDTTEDNASPLGEQEVGVLGEQQQPQPEEERAEEVKEEEEEEDVSTLPRRKLVWSVWREVQMLEKDIKENMVSTTTTSATEKYIRDAKTEILHLLTGNEHLKNSNKDMEGILDKSLNGVVLDDTMRKEIWDSIRSSLGIGTEEQRPHH